MVSLYEASVPVVIRILKSLLDVLAVASTHATSTSTPLSDVVAWKLHDDMLPLYAQVLIANSAARRSVDRLTGRTGDLETAKLERKEMSFDECVSATKDTIAMLEGLKPSDIDGREAEPAECAFFQTTYRMPTERYVSAWTLPTCFFHLDTTYAILRHKGVPLGKKDYQAAFLEGAEVVTPPAASS